MLDVKMQLHKLPASFFSSLIKSLNHLQYIISIRSPGL